MQQKRNYDRSNAIQKELWDLWNVGKRKQTVEKLQTLPMSEVILFARDISTNTMGGFKHLIDIVRTKEEENAN